jgi:hypothetical protein
MEQDTNNQIDADEAALDAELNASIEAVKAGNALEPEKPVDPIKKEEPVVGVDPKPATPLEDPSTPPAENKEEGYEFRIPNKGKFESDEAYEKRIELLDLVKQRKLATTPEKKQELSDAIKTTKNQLRNINGSDKINNPLNNDIDIKKEEEDPGLVADRERLKALGGATKEDIAEVIRQERLLEETKSSLNTFCRKA